MWINPTGWKLSKGKVIIFAIWFSLFSLISYVQNRQKMCGILFLAEGSNWIDRNWGYNTSKSEEK